MEYIFDKQRFRRYVAKSGILDHNFFKLINSQDISLAKNLLLIFLKEDYIVAKEFGQYLAYLISRIEDAKIRMLLIENLWDEHGNGIYDDVHFEQYKSLLKSLGVDAANLSPKKSDFIELHYSVTNENLLNGIALFTYADEFLSMYEFGQIKKACHAAFGEFDDRYFKSNQEADIEHTRQLEEALTLIVSNKDVEDSAFCAVEKAISSRMSFYDDILNKLNQRTL